MNTPDIIVGVLLAEGPSGPAGLNGIEGDYSSLEDGGWQSVFKRFRVGRVDGEYGVVYTQGENKISVYLHLEDRAGKYYQDVPYSAGGIFYVMPDDMEKFMSSLKGYLANLMDFFAKPAVQRSAWGTVVASVEALNGQLDGIYGVMK